MKRNIHTLLMLGAAGIVSAASGQNIPQARITVDVAREEAEIAPTMYGIFFEDINRSADGGMYAELIFNRGFEEKNLPSGCTYNPEDKRVYAPYRAVYSSPEQMRSWSIPWDIEDTHPGWTIEAADGASYSVRIDDTDHLQVEGSKAMYLSIDACREPFRLVNSGFYGLAVEAGEKYDLRFYVRAADGYRGSVTAEILAADGEVLAAKRFALKDNGAWSYFEGELKPSRTVNDGRFALRFDSEGSLEIDYVSLFPRHTFHNRPNGLRRDVAQFVADLKPAFMRWPGGCIVEGLTMENRVNWKNTIGKPELRKGEYNLWGYHSTNGFGYHEFLQYCEDIGCKAMFVCNAGMSCDGRNGDFYDDDQVEGLIQVHGAQPIDQFVFRDDDGEYYMYYGGWGHCNMVRLAPDLLSVIPFEDGETFKEITPENYVEGPFMLKRQGKYYFMWSEGGWGGPDYSVAYAIADSPFGPFERVGKILQQDPEVATGAGHHSVIRIPGKDEWYIVYHRRPLGDTDMNHRQTCIDRMEFDDDGFIKPVKITFGGIEPVRIGK